MKLSLPLVLKTNVLNILRKLVFLLVFLNFLSNLTPLITFRPPILWARFVFSIVSLLLLLRKVGFFRFFFTEEVGSLFVVLGVSLSSPRLIFLGVRFKLLISSIILALVRPFLLKNNRHFANYYITLYKLPPFIFLITLSTSSFIFLYFSSILLQWLLVWLRDDFLFLFNISSSSLGLGLLYTQRTVRRISALLLILFYLFRSFLFLGGTEARAPSLPLYVFLLWSPFSFLFFIKILITLRVSSLSLFILLSMVSNILVLAKTFSIKRASLELSFNSFFFTFLLWGLALLIF